MEKGSLCEHLRLKTRRLNHLGSIWYHSEPSDVPYSENLLRPISWFGLFLQQNDSSTTYQKKWRPILLSSYIWTFAQCVVGHIWLFKVTLTSNKKEL